MTTSTLAPKPVVTWKAYLALCKLRVVGMIVFTAIIGMFLAMEGLPPLTEAFWGAIGIGLALHRAPELHD